MTSKIKIGADELDKLGEKIKEKIISHLRQHTIKIEITISKLNKLIKEK